MLPYAEAALDYYDAEWEPVPVVPHGKKTAAAGRTGRSGICPSREEIEEELADHLDHNIALRMPEGVVGLDVDHYGNKTGGATLARLENELGALVPTVRSSSREGVSGIRFYRVPPETELVGGLGDIDLIQRHHRYALVWPSIHPEGRVYRWYGPDGEPMDEGVIPSVADLPELPSAWVAHLSRRSREGGKADLTDGQEVAWWDEHGGGEPCEHVEAVLDQAQTPAGSRHDHMIKNQFQLVALAAEGHPGMAAGMEGLREWFEEAIGGDRATDKEWADGLSGAIRSHPSTPWRGCHPEHFRDADLIDHVVRNVFGGRFLFARGLGWMEWNGQIWSPSDERVLNELLRIYVQERQREASQKLDLSKPENKEILKGWLGLFSHARRLTVVHGCEGRLLVDGGDFDTHHDLLNCPNGVVDLRTGELLPHDPDLLMTRIAAIDYDPHAADRGFGQILSAAPKDCLDWLQLKVGQAATGHAQMGDDDPNVVLRGAGSNGKTSWTNSLRRALGTYATKVPKGVLTAEAAKNEMMTLRGARFALVEELPEGSRINTVALKEITDTDELQGRHLYQDLVTWTPTHTLFITTNELPQVSETTHAVWRRLALVEFPYTFTSRKGELSAHEKRGDPVLARRIRKDDPKILAAALRWIVEGARRYYACGMVIGKPPKRVQRDTREWRKQADFILAYWDSGRIEADSHSFVLGTDLYADFCAWREERGDPVMSAKRFSPAFASHQETERHHAVRKHAPTKSTDTRKLSRPANTVGDISALTKVWQGIRFVQRTADSGDVVTLFAA